MLGKRRKKTDLPAVCAVIVAAGSSRRMGGENKLLLEIDGVPVLARDAFRLPVMRRHPRYRARLP